MWSAASLAESVQEARCYGFELPAKPAFDWPSFKRKRDAYIDRLNGIYARNLDSDQVQLLRGRAQFESPQQVRVTLADGSSQVVRASKVVIATGGHPRKPDDIPGADLGLTSDGFFELGQQPRRVAVVGAGYIAVEFAGVFHALGSETHLFVRNDTFLRSFDPMIQDRLTAEYERQGIRLHRQSAVDKVERVTEGSSDARPSTDGDSTDGDSTDTDSTDKDTNAGPLRLHYHDSNGTSTVEVDCLIWAIGRVPETEDLQLQRIPGLRTDERGHIIVDKYQNSSHAGVFALGDVCDRGFELTPVAIAAGRRLADRLFGPAHLANAHLEYSSVPSVVFAHPEAGTVGLTEPQARKEYGDSAVRVYTSNFTAMHYAMVDEDLLRRPTSYKLVCAGPDERVVGLHIVGLGSSEILQGFGVAIKMGATKADFDRCVAIHPTSAEELVTMK